MVALSKPPRPELKGRPPLRKCPDDFDVIFVEQGRLGCEAWYRARRSTVDRWLRERGKQRLINERAAYVSSQRKAGNWLTRSSSLVEIRKVKPKRTDAIRDRRRVNPTLARHAAQYLRVIRNGGFIISPTPQGDWFVGSRRLSPAQMIDLAMGRGFDVVVYADEPDPYHEGVHSNPQCARPGTPEQRAEWNADWSARFSAEREGADLKLGANWQDKDL